MITKKHVCGMFFMIFQEDISSPSVLTWPAAGCTFNLRAVGIKVWAQLDIFESQRAVIMLARIYGLP